MFAKRMTPTPHPLAPTCAERPFLALAALLGAAVVAGAPLGGPVGWAGVAAAVALFGLPHGALDAAIARTTLGLNALPAFAAFLLAYAALAAAVTAFWLAAPLLALALFLAMAAVHFGADFARGALRQGVVGGALLALPAAAHPAAVADIFAAITFTGRSEMVATLLQHAAPLVSVAAILAASRRRISLCAYALLALTAPPQVTFAAYFCALHAPLHFAQTARRLALTPSAARAKAAPYALAAAAGAALAAAVLLAGGRDAAGALAPVIFVGLAALTVPHMVLERVVSHRRAKPAGVC